MSVKRWYASADCWRGRIGAGDGNRTRTTSLEGWGSTIELHPQPYPQRNRGGGGWIRTNVGVRQRIYSPSPLATRAPLRTAAAHIRQMGGSVKRVHRRRFVAPRIARYILRP